MAAKFIAGHTSLGRPPGHGLVAENVYWKAPNLEIYDLNLIYNELNDLNDSNDLNINDLNGGTSKMDDECYAKTIYFR